MSSLEVSDILSPDQLFPGSGKVQLVQFGPHGVFGINIFSVEVLSNFLHGKLRLSKKGGKGGDVAMFFQEEQGALGTHPWSLQNSHYVQDVER